MIHWTRAFLAALPLIGFNGPVTVILDTPEKTATVCSTLSGERARGCITIMADAGGKVSYVIRCAVEDADCLAHEIRHIIEPLFHAH